MKYSTRVILPLLLAFSFSSQAFSQIYKWKDKDGNVILSSTPPPPGVKWEHKRTEVVGSNSKTGEKDPAKPEGSEVEVKRSYRDIKVIMYTTDWCPVCRKARTFLNSLGVNLIEHDVEKDPEKNAEWLHKAGSSKVVPIIDIEGTILAGLNSEKIKAAIEEKRKRYRY